MTAGAIILLKALFYVGSLTGLGIGIHVALRLIEPKPWLRYAALLLAFSILLRVFSLNLEIVGALDRAFDVSMFSWVWPGIQAQVLALAAGTIVLAVASIKYTPILAMLGADFIVAGFGLSGHTQSLDGAVLAPFAVAFHVGVAGFWIMAPISLWPRSGDESDSLATKLHQFSRTAQWLVPIMIALGLWLCVEIAGSVEAVFQTTYGRLLLFKLAVILIAVGLGAFNKTYVTSRLEMGEVSARGMLKRVLALDTFLFLMAITAVAAATTLFGPH